MVLLPGWHVVIAIVVIKRIVGVERITWVVAGAVGRTRIIAVIARGASVIVVAARRTSVIVIAARRARIVRVIAGVVVARVVLALKRLPHA
jgi:hypothetical protein